MSIFGWFKAKGPKVSVSPQPVDVNGQASDERLIRRLSRLYLWLEQRPDADPDKTADVKKSMDIQKYALAARGYPLCETREDVMDLVKQLESSQA